MALATPTWTQTIKNESKWKSAINLPATVDNAWCFNGSIIAFSLRCIINCFIWTSKQATVKTWFSLSCEKISNASRLGEIDIRMARSCNERYELFCQQCICAGARHSCKLCRNVSCHRNKNLLTTFSYSIRTPSTDRDGHIQVKTKPGNLPIHYFRLSDF